MHLTPSQIHGVVSQQDYMLMTGSRVVQNLSGAAMQHVEPGDFISHLRTFQGGLELSRLQGKVSSAYTVVTPKAAANPRYFRYVFKSAGYISQIASLTDQLRDGQSMRFAEFNQTWLPLPPVEEQRQIADYLDYETAEVDEFIADLQRLVVLTDERLLAEWSKLFMVACRAPSTQVRHLVSSLVDGPFGSALTSSHYADSGTPVVRLGNIGRYEFRVRPRVFIPERYAQQLSSHSVRAGDVVIAGLGDANHPLGRSAVVPVEFGEGVVKADCYRARVNGLLTPSYLAWALSSPQSADRFREASRGSTRSRLNLGVVAATRIPVPSIGDQHALVTAFQESKSSAGAALADLDAAITLASERRAALITAAVTGQIDVTAREKPVVDSIQTAIEEAR